jgi:hypothetical protein
MLQYLPLRAFKGATRLAEHRQAGLFVFLGSTGQINSPGTWPRLPENGINTALLARLLTE